MSSPIIFSHFQFPTMFFFFSFPLSIFNLLKSYLHFLKNSIFPDPKKNIHIYLYVYVYYLFVVIYILLYNCCCIVFWVHLLRFLLLHFCLLRWLLFVENAIWSSRAYLMARFSAIPATMMPSKETMMI